MRFDLDEVFRRCSSTTSAQFDIQSDGISHDLDSETDSACEFFNNSNKI
jgi:hypothetical protein